MSIWGIVFLSLAGTGLLVACHHNSGVRWNEYPDKVIMANPLRWVRRNVEVSLSNSNQDSLTTLAFLESPWKTDERRACHRYVLFRNSRIFEVWRTNIMSQDLRRRIWIHDKISDRKNRNKPISYLCSIHLAIPFRDLRNMPISRKSWNRNENDDFENMIVVKEYSLEQFFPLQQVSMLTNKEHDNATTITVPA